MAGAGASRPSCATIKVSVCVWGGRGGGRHVGARLWQYGSTYTIYKRCAHAHAPRQERFILARLALPPVLCGCTHIVNPSPTLPTLRRVQVKGKVNTISLDKCTRVGVVFGDVISSVEAVNCSSIQMQVGRGVGWGLVPLQNGSPVIMCLLRGNKACHMCHRPSCMRARAAPPCHGLPAAPACLRSPVVWVPVLPCNALDPPWQVLGTVPTLAIEKTDGAQLYVSKKVREGQGGPR